MKPWLLYKPAFNVIGIPHNDGDLNEKIDVLWDQLAARYAEIPHADPDQGYGVHKLANNEKSYLAGLAVDALSSIPDGMVAQFLPANAYAVFMHHGLMAHLADTVEMIFRTWLPGSAYQWAGEYYFEVYDDRFQPGSAESLILIYLPVKEEQD
jgi:predicted transcriptional regulator YdeE